MQQQKTIHFLELLRDELQKTIPGVEAQNKMMPLSRLKMSLEIPDNVKNGAVILMLYLKDNKLTICFIKRATDGGVHSGQIGFPGGKKDETDKDLIETALREAKEEIGIIPGKIQVLGKLSDLYIPVSNYIVYPFVGFYSQKPKFKLNKSEVDELVEVSLKKLINPAHCAFSEITINNSKLKVPCYIFGKHKIWGATAMILSEFVQILTKRTEIVEQLNA
jgi:8-oxo-dGTP pyrophosphatase MutT (NUDIX family)